MQLQVGSRVTARIEDVAFGGEGVARPDNFVVFVPFVLRGELVEAEIIEIKKAFARARLVQVLEPSPDRTEPECAYFGKCGGCQYQHMAYPAQLRVKHKQVADLFERLGGFDPALIQPVVPCPVSYGYRNRIMIRSQWNKPKQKLNIGFVRHDCGLVVDVGECKIAEPVVSAQIEEVRKNPPPRGGLKVVLRLPPEDWEVPDHSFFQNNFHLLPDLVNVVRERVVEGGVCHLVDAYCGVGFFGIELADVVASFTGVEYDAHAIKAARRNAEKRGVANGEFISGKTEEELPALLERVDAAKTAVILDPPRKGCRPEALTILRQTRPRQILYVSCHPATMARDLKLLCGDQTYSLKQVVPLDMFPQTQHVECVADLRAQPTHFAGSSETETCQPA